MNGTRSSWRRHVHAPVAIALGRGHEPETDSRHDAEVRLREEPVDDRSEAVLVLMPEVVPGHPAHAGAQQLAIRQHDLEAADRVPVVLHRRAAAAALERVAERRAPAGIGRVDPDVELVLLDVTVEVEVAHARFDDGVVDLVVDLEHAVHALEIDDHAARVGRGGRAVTQVAAGRDRPERNLVLVRDPHDRLHLLDACRARRRPTRAAPRARPRTASTRRGRASGPRRT